MTAPHLHRPTTDHPPSGPAVARIRSLLPSLQPSDRRVARAVLDNPTGIVHLTANDVAAIAGTAASTVVRACQRLGYRGFHDLKLALARDSGANERFVAEEVLDGDAPGDILRKVLASDATAIREAGEAIDAERFTRAVHLLGAARRVLFVGVGTSSPLAQDAAYRFTTVGLHAEAPADTHVQHVTARLLGASDLCVAISHTGSTTETVASASAAREAGAATIALTSFIRSPLTETCDLVLVAGSGETSFRLEAMASRVVHQCLLDALLVALARAQPVAAQRSLDMAGRVLSDHRY